MIFVQLRGDGWMQTFPPREHSSILMRHSGQTAIGYFRRKQFHQEFAKLDMSIRINEGETKATIIKLIKI